MLLLGNTQKKHPGDLPPRSASAGLVIDANHKSAGLLTGCCTKLHTIITFFRSECWKVNKQ